MAYSVRRNAHKRDFPRLKGCGNIIIYLCAINAGNAISAGINAKRGRITATPSKNIVIMKSKRLRIRTGAASPRYSSFLDI